MWLPLLGLLAGLVIGLAFSPSMPPEYARYAGVWILATLDALMGAVRAELNKGYDNRIFVSGFVFNSLLATALTFVGDRLGVDFYLVAIVAFGVRIFNNLAIIRRHFI